MTTILEAKNIKKIYSGRFGKNKVMAVENISFSIENGEFVAIMGESGSGKTTLLNMLASFIKPTQGEVIIGGRALSTVPPSELSAFRRDNLGFIFQDFNLLDSLSLKDNIFLPLVLQGKKPEYMDEALKPIADRLEITSLLDKYPYEVSGGQKQRAAAARALITKPRIILADEPTGALDSRAAGRLMQMLGAVNSEGQTILMVTHSIQAAKCASRVLFIKDGKIYHQIYRGEGGEEEMYRKISDALAMLENEKAGAAFNVSENDKAGAALTVPENEKAGAALDTSENSRAAKGSVNEKAGASV